MIVLLDLKGGLNKILKYLFKKNIISIYFKKKSKQIK
jgi:hypothetical protein